MNHSRNASPGASHMFFKIKQKYVPKGGPLTTLMFRQRTI